MSRKQRAQQSAPDHSPELIQQVQEFFALNQKPRRDGAEETRLNFLIGYFDWAVNGVKEKTVAFTQEALDALKIYTDYQVKAARLQKQHVRNLQQLEGNEAVGRQAVLQIFRQSITAFSVDFDNGRKMAMVLGALRMAQAELAVQHAQGQRSEAEAKADKRQGVEAAESVVRSGLLEVENLGFANFASLFSSGALQASEHAKRRMELQAKTEEARATQASLTALRLQHKQANVRLKLLQNQLDEAEILSAKTTLALQNAEAAKTAATKKVVELSKQQKVGETATKALSDELKRAIEEAKKAEERIITLTATQEAQRLASDRMATELVAAQTAQESAKAEAQAAKEMMDRMTLEGFEVVNGEEDFDEMLTVADFRLPKGKRGDGDDGCDWPEEDESAAAAPRSPGM